MNMTRTYPNGVPCWVDLESPDPEEACRFYGGLFGWEFSEAMPAGQPGSYRIAQLGGQDVCGVAPGQGAAAWNTYIAVDDADATADQAVSAGAQLTNPPEDAGPGGRWAGLTDPVGAHVRLWQPRRRLGAQRVNDPGSWNFNDLHTSDPAAAKRFYERVFGWEADEVDAGMADGSRSVMWRRPGYGDHLAATLFPDIHAMMDTMGAPKGFADAVGWIVPLEAGETPHWDLTFAVADRDEAVARAVDFGATDLSGPIDTKWTHAADMRDPQGATFTLSQFVPPEQ